MNKSVKWTGAVTKAALPVRVNPSAKSREHSFSPISKGVTVQVCDTSRGWLYISVGGKYGYVSAKWIKFTASCPDAKISKTAKWIGRASRAIALRTLKGTKTATIPKGAVMTVCDTVDGKWYVKYGTKYGYVSVKYVNYVGKAGSKQDVFLEAVKAVQEYARAHKYIYADSQSTVPTADHKISCDRLVAKALWDLGYHDQVKGGIALGRGFEEYLMKHGFKRSTSMKDAKPGSVFVVMNPSGSSRHVFVIASKVGENYTRYDCGSLEWIRSKQPLAGLWMSRLIALYNIQ